MASDSQQMFRAGESHGQAEEQSQNLIDSTKDSANAASEKASQASQSAKDSAQRSMETASEKASHAAQSTKETAKESKDSAAGFLQQTGEQVMNLAQGAVEGVKNTLGVGDSNSDK